MQNQYLFRGKRVDNGELVTGDLIHGNLAYIATNLKLIQVIPETVEQCTGLPDIHKALIFESDELEITRTDDPKCIYNGIVVWDDYSWQAELGDGSSVSLGYLFRHPQYCEFEIIGNVHENLKNEV